MTKQQLHDREWLESALANRTPRQVADELGVAQAVVNEWISIYALVPHRWSLPGDTTIPCMICHQMFGILNTRHIGLHGMTVEEYQKRFPHAPLRSPAVIAKKAKSRGPLSAETKAKISAKHTGKTLSKEHREAIARGGTGKQHSEETRQKMRDTASRRSTSDISKIVEKARNTSLKNWGVENPMQHSAVAQAAYDASVEKYGEHHTRRPDVIAKAAETSRRNHDGVHHTQHPNVQAKIKATNLKKYGVEHTMGIARAAISEKFGTDNVFKLSEFQAKARQTMIARYGVSHALQSPQIMARMRRRNLRMTGYENPLQNPVVQAKIKNTIMEEYNRKSPHQAHFSDDTYELLYDKEAFCSFMETRSLRQAAKEIGVAYDTLRKHCYRNGHELPKSSYEREIATFLRQNDIEVRLADRKILDGDELDIVSDHHRIAIEFCGLYWHQEDKRDRLYHISKHMMCEFSGYRLFTIFEDEWVSKRQIVESRLLNAFGKSMRGPGARKLTIKKILGSVAKNFLEEHHIQGAGPYGFANYGAYDTEKLVAVMNFTKPRMALGRSEGYPELLRFATDGKSYAGIASKLFKTFLREYEPDGVVSYADRRWSFGDLYKQIGFDELKPSKPGYWYVWPNRVERLHRYKFRKDQIVHLVPDGESKTEAEIMRELKYYRVWDCGHYKFQWTK